MSRSTWADVRFYVDADLLGLAHALTRLRSDVTYPGDPGGELHRKVRPPCPIVKPGAPDDEWIPTAAAQGWLIITRDKRIQGHVRELAACRDNAAKMVNLTADDAGTTWGQLRVVLRHWSTFEGLHSQPGPFIYRVTLTTISPIDLRTGKVANLRAERAAGPKPARRVKAQDAGGAQLPFPEDR